MNVSCINLNNEKFKKITHKWKFVKRCNREAHDLDKTCTCKKSRKLSWEGDNKGEGTLTRAKQIHIWAGKRKKTTANI